MTKEEIVALAREAGFEELGPEIEDWVCYTNQIESFAQLVAAVERAECARACWEFYSVEGIAQKCNAAIRARGRS